MAQLQEQKFEIRFTFHLIHYDGKTAQELCMLNFFANPKEHGNADLAVENSVEITNTFGEITKLFQRYMKQITVDQLYKNHENDLPYNEGQNNASRYIFKLVDHYATTRTPDNKLSTEKEIRVIYESEVFANDFASVQTPFSILPIWKDVEYRVGIRTLLKDMLSLSKYTNRFKRKFYPTANTFCINSTDNS
jgi:hypothetical protein